MDINTHDLDDDEFVARVVESVLGEPDTPHRCVRQRCDYAKAQMLVNKIAREIIKRGEGCTFVISQNSNCSVTISITALTPQGVMA